MDQLNELTDNEVVVVSTIDQGEIDTCSLVLAAVEITHQMRTLPDGTTGIVVPAALAPTAAAELDSYFRENRNWPPALAATTQMASPRPPTFVIVAALALFHLATGPWRPESHWFAAGAGDASAIIYNGQWYRLVTALTLHADFAHLAGNCLIGGIVLHYFLQIHGAGIGLLAVIFSGLLGNYLNVQLHGGDHVFVGFSTSVFSTIGMLSAHQMLTQRPPFTYRFLVPLLGGAGLLAMLGSSGARTDLGGHLFGLLSGIGCGLLLELPFLRRIRDSSFSQTCLLLATILLILICWNMALQAPAP